MQDHTTEGIYDKLKTDLRVSPEGFFYHYFRVSNTLYNMRENIHYNSIDINNYINVFCNENFELNNDMISYLVGVLELFIKYGFITPRSALYILLCLASSCGEEMQEIIELRMQDIYINSIRYIDVFKDKEFVAGYLSGRDDYEYLETLNDFNYQSYLLRKHEEKEFDEEGDDELFPIKIE